MKASKEATRLLIWNGYDSMEGCESIKLYLVPASCVVYPLLPALNDQFLGSVENSEDTETLLEGIYNATCETEQELATRETSWELYTQLGMVLKPFRIELGAIPPGQLSTVNFICRCGQLP